MLETFHSRFFSHMAEQFNLKYYFKLARNKYQGMLVHFWKTSPQSNPFRLAHVKSLSRDGERLRLRLLGSCRIVPTRTVHGIPCSLLSFRQVSIEIEWRLHLGFLERNVSLCSILNSTPTMSPTSKYMLSNVKRCHRMSPIVSFSKTNLRERCRTGQFDSSELRSHDFRFWFRQLMILILSISQ